jgi:hypothetical protein
MKEVVYNGYQDMDQSEEEDEESVDTDTAEDYEDI